MSELISIIVPIYNVEQYLNKCIESIVNQTYNSLEIILVDDGSPDNCPAMCDEWTEKDSRIKVIHKKNGGLSDARNAGMDIATGSYIAFVDSDDYIEPDMYEKLLDVLNQTNADISVCNLRYIYENEEYSLSSENTNNITEYSVTDAMSALIADKIRQVVWNKLYKAELIKSIQFDVGKYHEDEFWSYKAIGGAKKIATIDYTGYNYLQRNNSIMGSSYSLKRLDAIEAKMLRQDYLNNNFPELAQLGYKNLLFTCLYHGQLAIKYLNKETEKQAVSTIKTYIKSIYNNIDINCLGTKEKIWFLATKISFVLTCKIKNFLGIGL